MLIVIKVRPVSDQAFQDEILTSLGKTRASPSISTSTLPAYKCVNVVGRNASSIENSDVGII